MLIIFLLISAQHLHAYTFKQVAKAIDKHPRVEALLKQVEQTKELGINKSAWGDPVLGVTAKNFPKDSLARDKSPMTGIEYSIRQNLPLTTKYNNIKKSFYASARAQSYQAINQKKTLHQLLWGFAISQRNVSQDLEIIEENLGWLRNMLKVSEKRYATGKLSQQAVLELRIRVAELEAQQSNKNYTLSQIKMNLDYLKGDLEGGLDLATVPWELLDRDFSKEYEPNEIELGLKEEIKATDLMLKAQKLDYVPDVSFMLSYTQRDKNIDNNGDFVSAGIAISLPLSSKKYAQVDGTFAQKLKNQNELKNYSLKRVSELKKIELQIAKLATELKIIEQESLVFARSSRQITEKSYGLGNATYVELLQAELKYQSLLLRKNELKGQYAAQKVEYLMLRGGELYEK